MFLLFGVCSDSCIYGVFIFFSQNILKLDIFLERLFLFTFFLLLLTIQLHICWTSWYYPTGNYCCFCFVFSLFFFFPLSFVLDSFCCSLFKFTGLFLLQCLIGCKFYTECMEILRCFVFICSILVKKIMFMFSCTWILFIVTVSDIFV